MPAPRISSDLVNRVARGIEGTTATAVIKDTKRGIEVMDVVNTVPEWAAMLGLARIWCLAQDVWNLPSRIK